ncbi:lactonase family protein [Streptomyces sp. NPDC059070]|uniref:lactonase family protein n=1 Tax=unclassified Streptomyces TaxID=2593676 RepID=UPI0034E1AFB8
METTGTPEAVTELGSGHPGDDPNPPATARGGFVYVMSNQETGNSVTVFARDIYGGLTRKGTYPTGGLGIGRSYDLEDASDPLVSQGSLIISADKRFLFGVDAGSNEVSSLAIEGDRLRPVSRVPSGGLRPVSLTVHGNLLYVANSADASIAGFTVGDDGVLTPVDGSRQYLSGGPDSAPSQITFTPDGTQLVATERQLNALDVFPVDAYGRAGAPVRNDSHGPAPFSATFHGDFLLVTEIVGGHNFLGSMSTYRVNRDGTLQVISGSVDTTEATTCWTANSTLDPTVIYAASAQSGTISGYRIDATGRLTLFPPDGHLATSRDQHATQDMAISEDGLYLYVIVAGFDEKIADPRLPNYAENTPYSNKMSIGAWRIEAAGGLTPLRGFGVQDDPPRVVSTGILAPSMGGLAPGSEGLVAI